MPNTSKKVFIAISCSFLIFFSCSKNSSTGPRDNPHVDFSTVFYGTNYQVYSVRMDWSPDGSFIVFAGGPSGNIWKVRPEVNSIPVPVSDISSNKSEDGGYTPSYLSDGRLAYYLGWFTGDQTMHIMAGDLNQVKNVPASSILHTFNGSHVGLTLNSASSPNELSVSGDGFRAVGLWNKTYTLDWSGKQFASIDISNTVGIASNFMISRDGSKIAFQSSGQIKWISFQGGTPNVIGNGACPSWNGDGSLLGYLDETGKTYKIYDFKTGQTKSYEISYSGNFQYPVLSWDGGKVAFRQFGTTETGIGIGILIN
jgi:Tol biopolymer transport system component